MLDELSCTEIERLHLELLPARTVMSMFMAADSGLTGGTGAGGGGTTTGGGTGGSPQSPFAFLKDMPLVGKMLAGA